MTPKGRDSRFPEVEIDQVPEDVRHRITEVTDKSGFTPNVFKVLAHRPDEFRAFFAYHDALMEKDSGLTKGEREMIVVVTSAYNNCLYCVVAHGAIVRIREKNPRLADQLATDYTRAEISERQMAMLDFALLVADQASEIHDDDFHVLHEHGFSDEDIWDIGAVAAFFALSNRLAGLTDMMPNDEFYALGRDVEQTRPKLVK
ncbi:MAG: peroxidase-related enzyme [Granulosicoccus sp.]|nr:peroxidase-related enzyme [Granulosicoccus sp.]